MPDFVTVAQTTDFTLGQITLVEVEDEEVAIAYVNGEYYAFGAECTHAAGPLDEGEIEGTAVICPWHGAEFDIRSGEACSPPAQEGIPTYPVKVEGTDIKICIS